MFGNKLNINLFPYIAFAILLTPVLIRLGFSGSMNGCFSKKYKDNLLCVRSANAIGHTAIGIVGGLLMSIGSLSTASLSTASLTTGKEELYIRSILIFAILSIYPLYNLIKRYKKHPHCFYESSFFRNLSDILVGIVIGYLVGYLVSNKDTQPFVVETNFQYITYTVLLVWLIIVLTLMRKTYYLKTG